MRREDRARRVAHQACRTGVLTAQPVQHHPLDTGVGRRHPVLLVGGDDRAAREVGVYKHGGIERGSAKPLA